MSLLKKTFAMIGGIGRAERVALMNETYKAAVREAEIYEAYDVPPADYVWGGVGNLVLVNNANNPMCEGKNSIIHQMQLDGRDARNPDHYIGLSFSKSDLERLVAVSAKQLLETDGASHHTLDSYVTKYATDSSRLTRIRGLALVA